jgi:CheY-like chemotaxis protein
LGLSQVYGFAAQSGGTAEIESQLGKGTTVMLRLPRAHGIAEANEPASKSVPLPADSGRILVVEDDPNVAVVVVQMLKEMGYELRKASNAEEALEILETDQQFDLVFSDVVMPGGINGIDLAEKIQHWYPTIRVLLTTGYARTSLPSDYSVAILRKPYGPQELAHAILKARKTA